MMDNNASSSDEPCSSRASSFVLENDDFSTLENEGITVWGRSQEVLEQQAQTELEIFARNSNNTNELIPNNLEEGEITEDSSSTAAVKAKQEVLDINTYLKRQEELRKKQEYKKSLATDKSKEVVHQTSEQVQEESVGFTKKKSRIDSQRRKSQKIETETQSSEETNNSSGSEYVPSGDDSDYLPEDDISVSTKSRCSVKRKRVSIDNSIEKVRDDGLIECYEARLERYYKCLEQKASVSTEEEDNIVSYHTLKGGLKVPNKVWDNLYRYQKEGVKWLWETHQKCTGGLLGDEMGLGKTVQVIAFLVALDYSRLVSRHCRFTGLGPTIIVCPATVIHQWVQHFHEWIPEFRVAVLHQSGSYAGKKINLIREINKCKSILITTYLGVLKYQGELSSLDWHYVILDEGHKIRNSTAKVTVAVKQLRTPYRLLLTGSPMQNNLLELWSLFDFTNPGMLGNQQTFTEHFANPIIHGGFINSTSVQTEHVNMILGRGSRNWYPNCQIRANMLMAITALRKICNHPDLYIYDEDEGPDDDEATHIEDQYGYYKRSGKMIVVSALLKIWKKQGHRVLLFSQGRGMVRIFERFFQQQGYKYLKMDGSTAISSRHTLIDKFNQDDSCFVFLLTTRVGGLGVNLTGANRVIIFDPDWNPATDTQAKERAWRIGQNRQVTIYRLLCAGTIEEKMYQRQVWKQLLSNKVLLDPRTNRFFRTSDLHDLFSIQEQNTLSNPETTNIFRDSRVKLQEKVKEDEEQKREKRRRRYEKLKQSPVTTPVDVEFSEEKVKKMRELAQQISKSLGQTTIEKPKKSLYQVQIEEERQKRLEEKQKLKGLTAFEIMVHNRNRTEPMEYPSNRIDDLDIPVTFEKALEISEKTAKIYHEVKTNKLKLEGGQSTSEKSRNNSESDYASRNEHSRESSQRKDSRKSSQSKDAKKKKHKKKSGTKDKVKIDTSGKIDGELVDGLVKTEIKKNRKDKHKKESNQDDFVLEKLFNKKGVSGALQHDSVVQGHIPQNIRIETEAEKRTEKALQALRKSRIDNWRW